MRDKPTMTLTWEQLAWGAAIWASIIGLAILLWP